VRAMLAAGLPSLQLRGAAPASAEDVAVGRMLRRASREAGASFVVNRDVRLAVELDADGVHLKADGPSPRDVRVRLPPGLAVGASCHDEAELARADGADWIFLGPVFPTASKPGGAALGLERLAALCAAAPAPVYAVGGVTAERLADCLAAGAVGVAAIRACWDDATHALVRAGTASGEKSRGRPGRS